MAAELGVGHVRAPDELEHLLGWDRPTAVPAAQYWTTSVAQRAVVNLRRKAAAPRTGSRTGGHRVEGLSFAAWLRAATSYLPRPLPRSITPRRAAPRADRGAPSG